MKHALIIFQRLLIKAGKNEHRRQYLVVDTMVTRFQNMFTAVFCVSRTCKTPLNSILSEDATHLNFSSLRKKTAQKLQVFALNLINERYSGIERPTLCSKNYYG